ncbi:MAG: hypothetical protein VW804_08910, partial [Verrucomicrobiota bacterium]
GDATVVGDNLYPGSEADLSVPASALESLQTMQLEREELINHRDSLQTLEAAIEERDQLNQLLLQKKAIEITIEAHETEAQAIEDRIDSLHANLLSGQKVQGNLQLERDILIKQTIPQYEVAIADIQAMIDPIIQSEQSLIDRLAAIQTQKITEQQDLVSGLIQKQASESDWMLALNRLSLEQHHLEQQQRVESLRDELEMSKSHAETLRQEIDLLADSRDLLEKQLIEIGGGLQTISVQVRESASDPQSRASSDDLNLLGQVQQDVLTGLYEYQIQGTDQIIYRGLNGSPDNANDDIWFSWFGALAEGYYAFDGTLQLSVLVGQMTHERLEVRQKTPDLNQAENQAETEVEVELHVITPVYSVQSIDLVFLKPEADLDPSDESEQIFVKVDAWLSSLGLGEIDSMVALQTVVNALVSHVRSSYVVFPPADDTTTFESYAGNMTIPVSLGESFEDMPSGSLPFPRYEESDEVVTLDYTEGVMQGRASLGYMRPHLTPLEQMPIRQEAGDLAGSVDDGLVEALNRVDEFYLNAEAGLVDATPVVPVLKTAQTGVFVLSTVIEVTQLAPGLFDYAAVPRLVAASKVIEVQASNSLLGMDSLKHLVSSDIILEAGNDFIMESTLSAQNTARVIVGGDGDLILGRQGLRADHIYLHAANGLIDGPEVLVDAPRLSLSAMKGVSLDFHGVDTQYTNLLPEAGSLEYAYANGEVTLMEAKVSGDLAIQATSMLRLELFEGEDLSVTGLAGLMVGDVSAKTMHVRVHGDVMRLPDALSGLTVDQLEIEAGGYYDESIQRDNANAVIHSNLNEIIDDSYLFHPQQGYQLKIAQDIIIDRELIVGSDLDFEARNILFTDKGRISAINGAAVTLKANNVIDLGDQLSGNAVWSGSTLTLNAPTIIGNASSYLQGQAVEVMTDSDVSLWLEVDQLSANLKNKGDLTVHSTGDLELLDVDIMNGSLKVESTGQLLLSDVRLWADRFDALVSLEGVEGVAITQLEMGQKVQFQSSQLMNHQVEPPISLPDPCPEMDLTGEVYASKPTNIPFIAGGFMLAQVDKGRGQISQMAGFDMVDDPYFDPNKVTWQFASQLFLTDYLSPTSESSGFELYEPSSSEPAVIEFLYNNVPLASGHVDFIKVEVGHSQVSAATGQIQVTLIEPGEDKRFYQDIMTHTNGSGLMLFEVSSFNPTEINGVLNSSATLFIEACDTMEPGS